MNLRAILAALLVFFPFQSLSNDSPPVVDHHQHLFSPATTTIAPSFEKLDAGDLVALLDAAGIRRALVLSLAYQFGNPNRPPIDDEYAQVKAENDWTSRQIGVQRILYGSDSATGGGLAPRAAWEAFRQLTLSDVEFRTIAQNIAPYMR